MYFDYIAQGQSLALVRHAVRRTLDSWGWYIVGVVQSAEFWNAAIDTVTFLLPLHLTALHLLSFLGKFMGNTCSRRRQQAGHPGWFHPGHHGRNSPEQSARARAHWRRAVQHISTVLRLRRRWNAIGIHLQQPRIQSLVAGLERVRGVLVRVQPASVAAQDRIRRAIAKAVRRRSATPQ